MTSLAMISDAITTTFIFPVFTEHLRNKFGLSIEQASFFFIITISSYFLTIQYLNKLSSKIGLKLTIAAGLFLNFIAIPFLSPLFFLPQSLIIVCLGQTILGLTGALINVPGIVDYMNTLENLMDKYTANDYSSG